MQQLPFTGRKPELSQIVDAIDKNIHLICVEGKQGIGKTRVLDELDYPGIVLRGLAREFEKSLTLQPVFIALRNLFNNSQWSFVKDRVKEELAPIWLNLLSCLFPEMEDSNAQIQESVSEQVSNDLIWESISQLFIVLAKYNTVVLVLDDLHFSDSSTIGFLEFLLRRTGGLPFHIVISINGIDTNAGLEQLIQSRSDMNDFYKIRLSPFTQEDMNELSKQFTKANWDELGTWLVQKTGGFPIFVNVIMHNLIKNDILAFDGNLDLFSLEQNQLATQSLTDLIIAMLNSISGPARILLETAAVAGSNFDIGIIAEASQLSRVDSANAQAELLELGFIKLNAKSEYEFDSDLTREVVYDTLDSASKRILHRKIGKILEQDSKPISAERIIKHLDAAGMKVEAIPYALSVGSRLLRAGAWREGIEYFEGALPFITEEEIPKAFSELRLMLVGNFQHTQANDTYKKLAEIFKRIGKTGYYEHFVATEFMVSDPSFYEIFYGMKPYLSHYDCSNIFEHIDAAIEWFGREGADADLHGISQSLLAKGLVQIRCSQFSEAIDSFSKGLAKIGEIKEKDESSNFTTLVLMMNCAAVMEFIGDYSGLDIATKGLKLSQKINMQYITAQFTAILAKYALRDNDYARTTELLNTAVSIAQGNGMLLTISDIYETFGYFYYEQGKMNSSFQYFNRALEIANSLKLDHQANRVLNILITDFYSKTQINFIDADSWLPLPVAQAALLT